MNESTVTPESGMEPMSRQPNYLAYQVSRKKGAEKAFWTKIGVAFMHRDGGGLNLCLDCLPTNGQVVLRAQPYGGAEA